MSSEANPKQTEPATRAVALRYDEESNSAPRVVASGVGEVADRILEAAEAAGVPVESDTDLIELLAGCELQAEIPLELYGAVAELLTWLFVVNGALKED
jgi:flagellar biosynthesis protein